MQTFSKLLALAATASAAIISIDVGEDGLVFSPESTTAAVGDTLQFHFYAGSGPHSVVKADFASPCKPDTGAFFSGLMAGSEDGSSVYEVAVTSTDPIVSFHSIFVSILATAPSHDPPREKMGTYN